MGIFTTYKTVLISDLSIPTGTIDTSVVLVADEKTFVVTDILVCNTSATEDIRINLKLRMQVGENDPVEAYRLKNALIKATASTNLMQLLVDQTRPQAAGDSLNLVGIKNSEHDPNTVTELIIFTNSKTQKCDCIINYIVLEETPWNGP